MYKLLTLGRSLPLERASSIFLILTVFALPISSSAKSIFLVFALISIIGTCKQSKNLMFIIKQPWSICALSLFGLAVIACLWSPASFQEKLFVLEKYSKLLYLPLLVLGFSSFKVKEYSLLAFMLAMLITSLLAILKFYAILPFDINPEHIFRNRIMTGFMAAFASYLGLWMTYQSQSKLQRALYLVLVFIYSYHVIFVNGSRTGYLIYFMLMGLLVIQIYNLKQAIKALTFLTAIFFFAYFSSQEMRERISAISEQVHSYKHHQALHGSIDMRLSFHDFAKSVFLKHPLRGSGTASFMYNFEEQNPLPAWGPHLLEPHSQYWLAAAEFGLLGLGLLCLLFYFLLKAALSLDKLRIPAIGLLALFIIGNLSDSLLFYSGSGYFFLLLMAICLATKQKPAQGYFLESKFQK